VASSVPQQTTVTLSNGGEAQIVQICFNRWNENCFLLIDSKERSCIVFDPGYGVEEISREIRERSVTVEAILATHTHFDHIASVSLLQQSFGDIPFLCHREELKILKDVNTYTLFLSAGKIAAPEVARFIEDGESIRFGSGMIDVRHMAGHTPGGCVFQYGKVLFTGDLLIKSQGRAHKLPGFDRAALETSWTTLFSSFSDDYLVFPGHGAATTVGQERVRFNTENESSASP
jgi:hydroxyacylglutathione hydrolase